MFRVGDRVMLSGVPDNPEWTAADVGIPEPKFGVVYTVSWVGLAHGSPPYIEEAVRLAEIDSGKWSYAAQYFSKVPPLKKVSRHGEGENRQVDRSAHR